MSRIMYDCKLKGQKCLGYPFDTFDVLVLRLLNFDSRISNSDTRQVQTGFLNQILKVTRAVERAVMSCNAGNKL